MCIKLRPLLRVSVALRSANYHNDILPTHGGKRLTNFEPSAISRLTCSLERMKICENYVHMPYTYNVHLRSFLHHRLDCRIQACHCIEFGAAC